MPVRKTGAGLYVPRTYSKYDGGESFSRELPLPPSDATTVDAAANLMEQRGVLRRPLRYRPTAGTALSLLQVCLDQALTGAANAKDERTRQAYNACVVRVRRVLKHQDVDN
jgi:hypothetical protein